MKNLAQFKNLALILALGLSLSACNLQTDGTGNPSPSTNNINTGDAAATPEISEKEQQALQAGVEIALTDIMQRALAQPCTPINLWFKPDPEKEEKAEVFLVNASCPDLTDSVQTMIEKQAAEAQAAAEQEAQAAPTETAPAESTPAPAEESAQ